MARVYSTEEISRHNHEKDLWIAIHGGVYDLTKFLKEHPGGEEVLVNLAGQDGTQCFDDIGHSAEAIKLRDTFKIGDVTGSFKQEQPSTSAPKEPTVDDDDWHYDEVKPEKSPWIPLFVAAGITIYAIIFYYLFY